MEAVTPPPEWFARYLRLLGIPARQPGREALTDLVRAQAIRVPFENVSKLYYRNHAGQRTLPTHEQFLDGIERYHFGGTCYTTNYYFYLLLARLGYKIKLCGAEMTNPDEHLVSMVTVDGREYIVDVGYAAPFLAPLPCDLAQDHVVALGRDRYVLKPRDREDRSRLELYRDGQLKHGYTVRPLPRQIEHFTRIIGDSFNDGATFMNALLLVRFFGDHSLAISNLALIRSQGTKSRIRTLGGREELVRAVEDGFGIPATIVAEAVAGLGRLRDAWS